MNARWALIVAVIFCACSASDAETTASDPLSSGDAVPVVTADSTRSDSEISRPEPPEPVEIPVSGSVVDPEDSPFVINGPASVIESCTSIEPGVAEFELAAGGAVRTVRIFMPETVIADPVPTVLSWHGLGSNGAEQAAYSGYETVAEQEGFAVVHVTAVPVAGTAYLSWELAQIDRPDHDDLAFVDALIDTLVADWCADPARIYSTGMSNGGWFTSELVCHRSMRIAAAVSVAGTSHSETCDPERAVPYMAFHGTDDEVVPFAGGDTLLATVFDAPGFFDQVVPDEFAEFAADAGCDLDPTRTEETAEVIRYDYTGCVDDVPRTFYELPGSGHTWPNSPWAYPGSGTATDVDATVDGWAFMSQHSL